MTTQMRLYSSTVVTHAIDSYSPLAPGIKATKFIHLKDDISKRLQHLFDTKTTDAGESAHPKYGIVLRDEDCFTGNRSICFCPVCGDDFNQEDLLCRHIENNQFLESLEEPDEPENTTDDAPVSVSATSSSLSAVSSKSRSGCLKHLDVEFHELRVEPTFFSSILSSVGEGMQPFSWIIQLWLCLLQLREHGTHRIRHESSLGSSDAIRQERSSREGGC